MRPLLAFAAAAVILMACRATAVDVEVLLTSGERCYGTLIADRDGELTIDRRVWSLHGTMSNHVTWPRGRVAKVQTVGSLEALYQERAAAAEKTYDGQYSLARWCLERGLQDHAFAIAKALWDREPGDDVTRQLLEDTGYLLDGQQWLTRADYAARHGLVSYEGKLMSQAEADARKAHTTAAQRAQAAEQRIADLEAARRARLDELGDATVALKRAERHQKQADDAAEAERRGKMSADDLADEEERRRFDQQHHVERKKPKEEDPQELTAARRNLDAADNAYRKVTDDLAAAKVERDAAVKERDEQWAKVEQLAKQAGRKP
jgi:hypothetical protein